ncbi:hypothetical protein H0H93_015666 [Arthromyces matolae]|nr:hypothetical protein H0H93_015666 [Arthromyces matolae]
MKTPVILFFPIAAELFLYASGIPIQHNGYNGFPIDSALIQRSGPNAPPTQGAPSGGHGTGLPPIFILPYPGLSSNNPSSSTDNVSRGPGAPSPASSIPLQNPSSRSNRPGANSRAPHTPFAQPQPPAQNSGVPQAHSSPPTGIAGGTSTPNDFLRMPANAGDLTARHFANELRRQAQELPISQEQKLLAIMELMPSGFESALVKQNPTTLNLNSFTVTWHTEMNALYQTQPESFLLYKKYLLIINQIQAISCLRREYNEQKAWDEYWVDNSSNAKLITTYLSKTRTINPLPQLAIVVSSLSTGDLEKLESEHGNTPQALVAMAEELEKQPNDPRIRNALVLRRKAIKMAVMSGLDKTYFLAQQEKLREIVPNGDLDNMARAEMAIISLRRFWSHVANRE